MLAAVASVACHDSDDTHVTVQYVQRAGSGVQGFLTSMQAGQLSKAFGADADLTPAPIFEVTTPGSGFVVVTFALIDTLGTIGSGATAIELRPNATFAVKVQIDSVNPKTACEECLGSKAFVLPALYQRSVADSIWMVWAAASDGKSITK